MRTEEEVEEQRRRERPYRMAAYRVEHGFWDDVASTYDLRGPTTPAKVFSWVSISLALPLYVLGFLAVRLFREIALLFLRAFLTVVEGVPREVTKLPSRIGIGLCLLEVAVAVFLAWPATRSALLVLDGVRVPAQPVVLAALANALALVTATLSVVLARRRVRFLRRCRGLVVAAETNAHRPAHLTPEYRTVTTHRALRDQQVLLASGQYELALQYARVVEYSHETPGEREDREHREYLESLDDLDLDRDEDDEAGSYSPETPAVQGT